MRLGESVAWGGGGEDMCVCGGGGAVVTARNGIRTPATLHRESNVLTVWSRHPYRGLPARIKGYKAMRSLECADTGSVRQDTGLCNGKQPRV